MAPQIDLKTQKKMSILYHIELHTLLNTNLLGVGIWNTDIFFKKLSNSRVFFIFQISLPFLISIIFVTLHGVYLF